MWTIYDVIFTKIVYYDVGYYSIDFIIDIICDHVMVISSF